MKVAYIVLAVLVSAYLWIGAFGMTREAYRTAQAVDLMPNLHIRDTLAEFLG